MNSINFHQILKWVAIVLLAGFIGQFGKYFATYLIERARKKKMKNDSGTAAGTVDEARDTVSPVNMFKATRSTAKSDKKVMKALMKMKKKDK
ncbi:MAG: hypothetical protein ABSB79_12280 [Syntrophales bacterium]|jgi:hypothetical protein